jgi:flavin reductase (DIM6/NTAB) family NADH-FMN oxidoreductase RutF
MDREGVANLAPSVFLRWLALPTLLFARSPRRTAVDHAPRRTHFAVEETGEFVVNVVSESIAAAANHTAADVPPEVDEFQLSGLTAVPGEVVRAPRVAESPAQMECKLLQVIYTSHKPGGGVIVLGEIVRFHVRAELVDNFRVDPAGLDAVGRMAGNTWVRTRDRLELIRPS